MGFTNEEIAAQESMVLERSHALQKLQVRYAALIDEVRNVRAFIQDQSEQVTIATTYLDHMLKNRSNPSAGRFFRAVCKTGRCLYGHKTTDPLFSTRDEALLHAREHVKPKQPHRLRIESVVRWDEKEDRHTRNV